LLLRNRDNWIWCTLWLTHVRFVLHRNSVRSRDLVPIVKSILQLVKETWSPPGRFLERIGKRYALASDATVISLINRTYYDPLRSSTNIDLSPRQPRRSPVGSQSFSAPKALVSDMNADIPSTFGKGAPRTPLQSGVIIEKPHDHDVLFGKGSHVAMHPGNVFFRKHVWLMRDEYQICRR